MKKWLVTKIYEVDAEDEDQARCETHDMSLCDIIIEEIDDDRPRWRGL